MSDDQVGFDFETALITDIIDNKAIRTVIKHKINADFFYGTQAKAAYLYLLSWFNNPNYGDTPSWESFQHAFPDFPIARVDESTIALCDKVREQKLYQDIASVVGEIVDIANGDPKGAFDTLRNKVSSMHMEHTVDESCDIRSKVEELRAEYFSMKSGATGLKGHPWPWQALNDSTLGLQDQHLVFLYGRPKSGKALRNDEPVLTPTGFVPIGSLKVGDRVIGSDGHAYPITGVYPQGTKPVYRVGTSDGLEVIACGEHLWHTTTRKERRRGVSGKARSTLEIMSTLRAEKHSRDNHVLPVVAPVTWESDYLLPLDPYLLGALLGDGCLVDDVTFTKPEDDIIDKVIRRLPEEDTASFTNDEVTTIRIKRKQRNNQPSATHQILSHLELHGLKSSEKFIPRIYLFADVDSRIALLQGLCDTDGSVAGSCIDFSVSSKRLADDVAFLARSLGALVTTTQRGTSYPYLGEIRQGLDSYRLSIRFNGSIVPVTSEKHLAKWNFDSKTRHRTISSVTPAGSAECTCISVDSPDHLFVTKDFLVTHNTWLALEAIRHLHAHGLRPLILSQEMSDIEMCRRFVALTTGVDYNLFLRGQLPAKVEQDFMDNLDAFVEQESIIVDMLTTKGDAAVTELAAKIDEYKVNVVLVDAVYTLGQDWKELVSVMSGFKRLAKVKRIPIIGTTQAHRQGKGKKAADDAADDFAYADAFYQWCDVAIRITSDIENKRKKEAILSTAALREGIPVTFTVNMHMATNLTQKAIIKTGEDEDIDQQIEQDQLDGQSDNPEEEAPVPPIEPRKLVLKRKP